MYSICTYCTVLMMDQQEAGNYSMVLSLSNRGHTLTVNYHKQIIHVHIKGSNMYFNIFFYN